MEAGAVQSVHLVKPMILGRYALYDELASGGMATVHLGRLLGPVGFSRTVAIKRLHPQFAKDPEFVSMFLDEARVAARIQHPNVVSTIDVVATEGELFLVMEYIEGESLSRILRQIRAANGRIPLRIVGSIITGMLHGLHAAHEARSERGEPLGIIHRDVSPQNVIIGVDGVSRVLDFGVAKAAGRMQHTREGQLKGKLAYMAPEQIAAEELDRRADIYAAGVVLWEALACRRLFEGENEGAIVNKIITKPVPPPSRHVPDLPRAVDDICLRALSKDRNLRFATALEMAVLLEQSLGTEPNWRVGRFVSSCAHEALSLRFARVQEMENLSTEVEGAVLPFAGGTPAPKSGNAGSAVQPRSSRPILFALLGMLLLSVVTSLILLYRAQSSEPRPLAGSSAQSSSAQSPGPVSLGASPSPNPAGPSASTALALAAPTPSSTPVPAATSAVPSVKVAVPVRPPGTSQPSAAGPPLSKPDCYFVENGIKKIRPACLK